MLEIRDEGLRCYQEELERQLALFSPMVEAKHAAQLRGERWLADQEYLLLVEHRPVYTLGRHGHAENMLLSPERLTALGAELVRTDRGGDITFHGPGQLVVYPIIDLERHGLGIKDYIHILEEAVILTLEEYGIRGERVEGATGVWIDAGTPRERKICAIGVRCSRFITMHGLALNVTDEPLRYFTAIHPCGFIDKGVTSIASEIALNGTFDPQTVNMGAVKARFASNFRGLLR